MSETAGEKLAREMAALRAKTRADADKVADTPTQKIRTAIGQGLFMGAGDEIEAAVMNPISALGGATGLWGTGEEYEKYLAETRTGLKAYQEAQPWGSLGYEVLGAAIPAVLSRGKTAKSTLARLTGLGGVQGGVTAFMTGEGGAAERGARVPGGILLGAATAGGLGLAGKVAKKPLAAFMDATRRKMGGRGAAVVEGELRRLASESGKTVDEIVDDVASGRIMAENATLADAVRAYRVGGGSTDLKAALLARPGQTRDRAIGEIQESLADSADTNVIRANRATEAAAKEAERLAYAPFKRIEAPLTVEDALKDALTRVPGAMDEINTTLRAQTGEKPFMRVVPGTDGNPETMTFARPPTLAEAEVVRRAVKNKATALYSEAKGMAGEAVKDVEKALREAIDEASPALSAARATASGVRTARDAFESGRKALAAKADQIEADWEGIVGKGPGAVNAFRAGFMDALRGRMGTGRGKATMTTLLSDTTNEGKILRTIFPPDKLPGVLQAIETASGAQNAATRILGGSDTAITTAQGARVGTGIGADDVRGLLSLDPISIAQSARKMMTKLAPTLSDQQRQQVVSVLISEEPALVRRALVDESAWAALQAKVEGIVSRLGTGARRAGAVQAGGQGGDISGEMLGGLLGGPQ